MCYCVTRRGRIEEGKWGTERNVSRHFIDVIPAWLDPFPLFHHSTARPGGMEKKQQQQPRQNNNRKRKEKIKLEERWWNVLPSCWHHHLLLRWWSFPSTFSSIFLNFVFQDKIYSHPLLLLHGIVVGYLNSDLLPFSFKKRNHCWETKRNRCSFVIQSWVCVTIIRFLDDSLRLSTNVVTKLTDIHAQPSPSKLRSTRRQGVSSFGGFMQQNSAKFVLGMISTDLSSSIQNFK